MLKKVFFRFFFFFFVREKRESEEGLHCGEKMSKDPYAALSATRKETTVITIPCTEVPLWTFTSFPCLQEARILSHFGNGPVAEREIVLETTFINENAFHISP